MKELDDLTSILKHKGFEPMKLVRGHGYRDYLRMDQHFARKGRGNVAMRITIWKCEDFVEGYINVYELDYRPTTRAGSRTEWINEKRYSSPQATLPIVKRVMLALVEEALADVDFRLVSHQEQEQVLRSRLTPDEIVTRDLARAQLAPTRERIAASMARVNDNRRKHAN